ncbi:MAG: MTAP family purine nucleoside phosphorylase, partial [Phycisphaerae bacterium]|jgi:5'-methylthioadenosine phosphorylase
MKLLGVSGIVASGATGSLREDIEPGHLVLCDQVIDKTYRRDSTFFDAGLAVHTEFAAPFCPRLRSLLVEASDNVDTTVHHAGTYVCMEGPQFSTRAESHMHRQWGGDLIGMTCMPEARLAREAEICYALVAIPTDYDCWRPSEPGQSEEGVLREVIANLHRASQTAVALIRATLKRLDGSLPACPCREALKLAIWSDRKRLDPKIRAKLDPLIGRYLADA